MRMIGGIRRLTDRIDDAVDGATDVLGRADTAVTTVGTVAAVAFAAVAAAAVVVLLVAATRRCPCAH